MESQQEKKKTKITDNEIVRNKTQNNNKKMTSQQGIIRNKQINLEKKNRVE